MDLNLLEATALERDMTQWVILDARSPKAWQEGHIPGAYSFSWEDYTKTDTAGIPYRILPPKELSNALGQLGIATDSAVLVYGDADSSWGGEGWLCWALAWLGHKGPVKLLNGGIQQWRHLGFPITTLQSAQPSPVTYEVTLHRKLNISAAELAAQRNELVLIDTRSTMEWFLGHIPQAIHINWKDFFHGDDNRPLTADELRQLLRKNNVPENRRIVYYCTGGVRSGYTWMVHELAGLPTAINFEGGIEEWNRQQP